jgi:tetratricopeptide (TPR) repeat protein
MNMGWLLQSYENIQAAKIERIKNETEILLNRGEPLKALHLIEVSNLPIGKLGNQYAMAINNLLKQAHEQYDLENFVTAGELYDEAHDRYPDSKSVSANIILSREEINLLTTRCADRLLETGLLAYRNGDLQEAINVWSQIRQFHPSYKASKQAIQTTRKQLENLEKIKNPS